MKTLRPLALAVLAAAGIATLAGCSAVDTVIWGSEGAQVIQTTDDLIRDLAAGEESDLVCEGFAADLGTAADWIGRSAGEPERFSGDFWQAQAALDPQWNINVEGLPEGVAPGDTFPGDLFYRQSDEGLCVIDVVWSTLSSEG